MRGTGYAIVEIIWWLLVAAAIGFAIGWILRKWFLGKELESEHAGFRADEERRRGELRLELEDWKGKATAFSSDLESRGADLDLRIADLDRANTQIAEREAAIIELDNSLKAVQSNVAGLEGQIADREATIASLRSSATSPGALTELQKQLDGANGTIGSLRKDTEGYQSTIASLRMDLTKANHDKTELAARVDTSASEAATIAASLAASRSNEETLRAQLVELEAGASSTADYQRQLADNQRQLKELESRLAATEQDRDSNATRLRDVEASHAGCAARLAEATRAAAPVAPAPVAPAPVAPTPVAPAPVAPTPVAAAPVAAPAVDDLPDRDVAVAKVAEIASRTRGAGPAVADDLKKIHGIGPKLDKLLKSMDITSFRQVANFTPDDIQYVTAALDAFPGRIERDDWMSGAAEQHSIKYGEPV